MESGKEIIYYDNGNAKYSGSYKDGEMHGLWKFYRRDGSLLRSGKFNLGKQIGVWVTCDRDGAVFKETDFGSKTK